MEVILNFSKRAGWIRLWWVVTISVTGWMIWVGQQESFDDRKLRSFKVQAAVVADIENPECGWLLIPARYVDDPAFSKQTSAMIGRAIANKSSDGALHGSCMQLNSFKIVLENRIFNRDQGLLPDFFGVCQARHGVRQFLGTIPSTVNAGTVDCCGFPAAFVSMSVP